MRPRHRATARSWCRRCRAISALFLWPCTKVSRHQPAVSEIELRAKLNHARGDALHAAADRAEGRREPVQINRLRIGIEVVEEIENLRAEFK